MTSSDSRFRATLRRVGDRVLDRISLDIPFVEDTDAFISPISSGLFLGANPTSPSHHDLLETHRVTHVVSCLPERRRDETAMAFADFEHLFLGLHDGMGEDIASLFPDFFTYIDRVHTSPANNVFVHCEVGVSRSATLVIAWIMRNEGVPFIEAFDLVKSKRVRVLPNIGFASQLQRYEFELTPDRSSKHSSLAEYLKRVCNVPASIDEVERSLVRHDYDAAAGLRSLFGGEIPRVVQGVRR